MTTVLPKKYIWFPQPDITPYELALCTPMLVIIIIQRGEIEANLSEALPPDAYRHFKKVEVNNG